MVRMSEHMATSLPSNVSKAVTVKWLQQAALIPSLFLDQHLVAFKKPEEVILATQLRNRMTGVVLLFNKLAPPTKASASS